MNAILGIDAAWTEREPSGVALIRNERGRWQVACVAPSYESFIACGEGASVDWRVPRLAGSPPDIAALIRASERMAGVEPSVVALDIPLANGPCTARRAADNAISSAFGSRGCSVHSPTAARPGPLSRTLTAQLDAAGFPLATEMAGATPARSALEVYPHPALLALLGRDYRVPYKVSRSIQYWPGHSIRQRIRNLLAEFRAIDDALGEVFGASAIPLPSARHVQSLAALKRYEDALDALVCAWVGLRFAAGAAIPYGDRQAAIWVPAFGTPRE